MDSTKQHEVSNEGTYKSVDTSNAGNIKPDPTLNKEKAGGQYLSAAPVTKKNTHLDEECREEIQDIREKEKEKQVIAGEVKPRPGEMEGHNPVGEAETKRIKEKLGTEGQQSGQQVNKID